MNMRAVSQRNAPFLFDQNSSPTTTGATGATGTYSQTGTTITTATLTHGLTSAANGNKIYLNCTTGAGGAGLFTNFTYVSATAFTCTSTISQSTSGNVALAANAVDIVFESEVVPGGTIGAHGSLRILAFWSIAVNNANAKTLGVNLGGTVGATGIVTGHTPFKALAGASALSVQTMAVIMNRNNQAKQAGYALTAPALAGSSTSAIVTGTVDTSVSQIVTLTGNAATAGDIITLEGYIMEVMQG